MADSEVTPNPNSSPEARTEASQTFAPDSPSKAQLDAIADKLIAQNLERDPESPPPRPQLKSYKHPMVVDLAIAMGLLFAMGALTVGFVQTYVANSARTSIMQGNYKAAIQILRGAPIPDVFGGSGSESSDELLNKALFLDSMEKLDNNRADQTALQELGKITPGSRFYDMARGQLEQLANEEREHGGKADLTVPPSPKSLDELKNPDRVEAKPPETTGESSIAPGENSKTTSESSKTSGESSKTDSEKLQ